MKKLTQVAAMCVVVAVAQQECVAQNLADMISPVSNPVNFEDPRHSTELRPIYVHHAIQNDFVTQGGDVNIYALQARFKLSDDFSIIATKDGLIDLNPEEVVPSDTGLANVALGAKYSVVRTSDSIVTTGLRYEIPLGDKDVLQGEGDGAINPFVSAGYTVENFNFMAGSGLRLRATSEDSSFWDFDLHADYKMGNFYPLAELNFVHVVNDGKRLPIPDEGADFFNLGASDSAGESIVSMGVGARYRFCENMDAGLVYQFPLDRGPGTGIFDWRLTADLIVRFDV